jgi:hypothetical protein
MKFLETYHEATTYAVVLVVISSMATAAIIAAIDGFLPGFASAVFGT